MEYCVQSLCIVEYHPVDRARLFHDCVFFLQYLVPVGRFVDSSFRIISGCLDQPAFVSAMSITRSYTMHAVLGTVAENEVYWTASFGVFSCNGRLEV